MAPTKERLIKLTVFHKRRDDVSEAEFQRFLTEIHARDVAPLHKKHGILKFTITHTPSSVKDIIAPFITPRPGWSMSEYDGVTEFWMRSHTDMLAVQQDPYWKEVIVPEDTKYCKLDDSHVTAGYEEVYVENNELVNFDDKGNSTFPLVEAPA